LTGEVYDYMIGLVIMGMIFVSAALVVPNLSYVNLLYVDQQQLRNIALETLKTMLLDTGYPVDWGYDLIFDPVENIQRFGLAYSKSSSFYVLDPNKVQRLDEELQSPYWNCVGYNRARDLLGLEGYGFILRIIPPFKVTVPPEETIFESLPELDFEVKVSRNDGRPLANAAVYATILYAIQNENNDENVKVCFTAAENSTGLLGTCRVRETLDSPPPWKIRDVMLVLKVTVADLATVTAVHQRFSKTEGIVDTFLVGDEVTMIIPTKSTDPDWEPWLQPEEANWVMSVVAYGEEGTTVLHSGGTQNTDKLNYGWGSDFKNWTRTFPGLQSSDPALLIFVVSAVPKGGGGRRPVLIAGPSSSWRGPRVLHYGGDPSDITATVDRNVIISGMTYLVEMTLWKETA